MADQSESKGNRTQILIVEDDENDQFLLARQLERAHLGDHFTAAHTGQEALEYLMRCEVLPLVILLDLNLPGLSGLELLEKIRDDPRWEKLPVIIMTGSLSPRDVLESRRLGAVDYLSKPIDVSTIIKIVCQYL